MESEISKIMKDIAGISEAILGPGKYAELRERYSNKGSAGTADLSFHKIQRSAAIAAGTNGYLGHLSKKEIDRRMANYKAIMDEHNAREGGRS